MKILRLTAENVKKLKAVEITPEGDLVEITGKNDQGKSSVLDSIWWALAGTKHIQAVPIRKGQKRARIRLDLGELVVERRFTERGSSLIVENAEGARYPSPQAMLDALVGELSFDPLEFERESPRGQFDMLRQVVDLDVDFDELDRLDQSDYATRTEVNREAKKLKAQADGIGVPKDLTDQRVDVDELKDRLQRVGEQLARIERERADRANAARAIEACQRDAVEARKKAAELVKFAKEREAEAEQMQEELNALGEIPSAPDVAEIRRQLDEAEAINRGIDLRDRRQALLDLARQKESESDQLTDRMGQRQIARSEAIARAEMPVEGLGFGDGVVTYQGLPFAQASASHRLRASMAIAMAANPKLRVLRIEDGSRLDEDNLALIARMAAEHDYQVWIERVDTSGRVGVVIEDGQVAARADSAS